MSYQLVQSTQERLDVDQEHALHALLANRLSEVLRAREHALGQRSVRLGDHLPDLLASGKRLPRSCCAAAGCPRYDLAPGRDARPNGVRFRETFRSARTRGLISVKHDLSAAICRRGMTPLRNIWGGNAPLHLDAVQVPRFDPDHFRVQWQR